MNLTKISRYISLILRHKPETINITLDKNGWADIQKLIVGIKKTYQLRDLQERGAIYINRLGGYHGDSTQEKLPFVHRDKLVFPNFKENEIRIKQFPNGEHWYAYIDDVQVRDGDTLKWNTYEEAYTQAKKYIDD